MDSHERQFRYGVTRPMSELVEIVERMRRENPAIDFTRTPTHPPQPPAPVDFFRRMPGGGTVYLRTPMVTVELPGEVG